MRKQHASRTKLTLFICIFLLTFSLSGYSQTYIDAVDTIQKWVEIRVENAQKGIFEKIEMPFVVRSLGWGCLCPDYYMGVNPNVQEGPWIEPIAPPDFPSISHSGHSLIVTGVFTGNWIEKDFRNKDGLPTEYLYKVPEFKILTWKINKLEYDTPPPRIVD